MSYTVSSIYIAVPTIFLVLNAQTSKGDLTSDLLHALIPIVKKDHHASNRQ
jgi:hypothetical protein